MRVNPLVILLAAIAAGGIIVAKYQTERLDRARASEATAWAQAERYQEALSTKKPPKDLRIPDKPEGVTEITAGRGRSEFTAPTPQVIISDCEIRESDPELIAFDHMSPEPDAEPASPLGEAAGKGGIPNWYLRPGNLRAEPEFRVLVAGGKPFARVDVLVEADTPHGVVSREIAADQIDLTAWVVPTVLDTPKRFAFTPRRLKHWRTGFSVGVGAFKTGHDAAEIGAGIMWGIQF